MYVKPLLSITVMLISFFSFSQDSFHNIFNIHDTLKKNANAIVRLDQSKIEISSINSFKLSYKRIITVLNSSGDNHVDAYVYYDEGRTIKKLQAVIYNQYGKEIKKVKKSDFKDVSAVSNFSLYEDNRVKYLDYTPTNYPYTVEFYYEITTKNTAYVPSWRPLEGYNLSTEKSSIEVVYHPSVGINKIENNLEGYTIEDLSSDGSLKYIATNVSAIRPEEYSPDFKEFAPSVSITPLNFFYEGYTGQTGDWDSLGKWMYDELLKERIELPIETQDAIKNLVQGVEDPIEKAKIVYQFVQENTRYISVQEGIGGIQPISAEQVDKVKYGDCKGLSNYTRALLHAVGVKSNYTRVFASPEYTTDINKNFVTFLGQTNHVILNIPNNNDDVWLECTSQTSPFNYTANFTDDRDVFVITPEGGEIVHTKAYKTSENLLDTRANITLDMFGNFNAIVTSNSFGTQYGYHEGVQNETLKEQKLQFKNYWSYINNLEVNSIEYINNKDSIVFTENLSLKATKYTSKVGDRLLLKPNFFNRVEEAPKRYAKRKLPFEVERGFTEVDTYEIIIPNTFEVEAMMTPVTIKNKFGEYSASIEQVGDKFNYHRKFILNKGAYLKEEYKAFREFWLKVIKYDNSKIVLKTKA